MLMQEFTPEMVETWKKIFAEYKIQLSPNRKTAREIIDYLEQKYRLVELEDEKLKEVVLANVMLNDCYKRKLPAGKTATARVFHVMNTGNGKFLYDQQDNIFKGQEIFVGIELETAFFHVEGSSILWDELFAFRGLDADDLNNYYLVAEYVSCLKKLDMMD